MRLSVLCTRSILLVVLFLGGCATTEQVKDSLVKSGQRLKIIEQGLKALFPTPMPMPARPLYVLTVSAGRVGNNELLIVDADTWQVARRTSLLWAIPWDFSRDPEGRIWIGYGAQPGPERRVQVFTADGSLIKTMDLCFAPILPIHFAAGRAFVPCLQNGFEAAVVVIDLTTLEVIQQVDIRFPDNDFMLISTGGNENYFMLIGNRHDAKWVIPLDTHTLMTLDPLSMPDSNPEAILTYKDRFILLNSIAESLLVNKMMEPLPAGRPDLLIIDTEPTPRLTVYEMEIPGALYGVIDGDSLVSYHNAERYGFSAAPARAVSRLNLVTDEMEFWSLPDGWNARDIAIMDDDILLAHSIFIEPESAGLYRFDADTGELTMLVNIPGANRIIVPTQ